MRWRKNVLHIYVHVLYYLLQYDIKLCIDTVYISTLLNKNNI